MEVDLQPVGPSDPAASPRETELEEKLAKRTMLLALAIAFSIAELLIVVELVRQAN